MRSRCRPKRLCPIAKLFVGDEVDHRLGELGELPIGLCLLGERDLKQLCALGVTEHLGLSASGAVTGDFIVLHPLGGGDQAGIAHAFIGFRKNLPRAIIGIGPLPQQDDPLSWTPEGRTKVGYFVPSVPWPEV
jgi:hypothetical protein